MHTHCMCEYWTDQYWTEYWTDGFSSSKFARVCVCVLCVCVCIGLTIFTFDNPVHCVYFN
jgi:hypothetical protein